MLKSENQPGNEVKGRPKADNSAMKVFSEAIKYLKNHLLKSLREKIPAIKDTDIHWVITVPAIWDDGAKQFMRKAGNEAGIPDNQLDLALEPEAAAIFCKAISVKTDGSCFEPGTQFILVDLGGKMSLHSFSFKMMMYFTMKKTML
ncbi:hypothetical protein CHS0354_012084 [Potamilus streckersoni]|uniref:Uncharacterized protein n=1 Tax=Potamilus streckersoni TaxID=2493646 RepID=A0AAE0SAI6_9BIVA|nr:hypothetical protein CHS0354_012084 [Potamilus streckersoni]